MPHMGRPHSHYIDGNSGGKPGDASTHDAITHFFGFLVIALGRKKDMRTLFILLDSLRRDYLTCYGNDWVHTPNISRLAERTSFSTTTGWVASHAIPLEGSF